MILIDWRVLCARMYLYIQLLVLCLCALIVHFIWYSFIFFVSLSLSTCFTATLYTIPVCGCAHIFTFLFVSGHSDDRIAQALLRALYKHNIITVDEIRAMVEKLGERPLHVFCPVVFVYDFSIHQRLFLSAVLCCVWWVCSQTHVLLCVFVHDRETWWAIPALFSFCGQCIWKHLSSDSLLCAVFTHICSHEGCPRLAYWRRLPVNTRDTFSCLLFVLVAFSFLTLYSLEASRNITLQTHP